MIQKLRNWWRGDARKLDIALGFMWALWGFYGLFLVFNFVMFWRDGKLEAASWVFNTAIWFALFLFNQKQSEVWRKLAKETLKAWGEGIESYVENMKPLVAEITRLQHENDALRARLGSSTEVSVD